MQNNYETLLAFNLLLYSFINFTHRKASFGIYAANTFNVFCLEEAFFVDGNEKA